MESGSHTNRQAITRRLIYHTNGRGRGILIRVHRHLPTPITITLCRLQQSRPQLQRRRSLREVEMIAREDSNSPSQGILTTQTLSIGRSLLHQRTIVKQHLGANPGTLDRTLHHHISTRMNIWVKYCKEPPKIWTPSSITSTSRRVQAMMTDPRALTVRTEAKEEKYPHRPIRRNARETSAIEPRPAV